MAKMILLFSYDFCGTRHMLCIKSLFVDFRKTLKTRFFPNLGISVDGKSWRFLPM